MSLALTRRKLLAGLPSLAAQGGDTPSPGIRRADKGIVWSPATPVGANLEYGWFDPAPSILAPAQKASLATGSISFVRGGVLCYVTPQGWDPGSFHSMTRNVLSVRPYLTDPTQWELSCDQGVYAIAPGELLMLSTPLTYKLQNGASFTIPARKALACTGGVAGTFGPKSMQVTPCKIRFSAGQMLTDNGDQKVPQTAPVLAQAATSSVQLLHRNFYLQGDNVLRPEVAGYVNQVGQWLAQGLAIDHSGFGSNWATIGDAFGLDAMQAIREQEWAFFAGQGWDPALVFISDENEASWDVLTYDNVGLEHAWNARWKMYFRSVLYPRVRHYFPQHTLGFGFPASASAQGVTKMNWCPVDCNTVARLHLYPDQFGNIQR